MSKVIKESDEDEVDPIHKPATTPEARENQLISLAVDLAEKQLRDGSASSQVITHYLKLAAIREKLEQRYVEKQIELADAKIEALRKGEEYETILREAIDAMKEYKGGV